MFTPLLSYHESLIVDMICKTTEIIPSGFPKPATISCYQFHKYFLLGTSSTFKSVQWAVIIHCDF